MIYLNGDFFETSNTDNKGFFYGYGCFETIMGLNKKCIFLSEHIERLNRSLRYLDIYREIDYKAIIKRLIKKNRLKEKDEFSLKIVVTDTKVYMKIKKMKLRIKKDGVKIAKIDKYYQNELGFLKSLNYMTNILARKELKRKKSFEGIFLNRQGYVTEGTISNVFWFKEGVLRTPALDLNILPGITRRKFLDIAKTRGIKIQEGNYTYGELKKADGIFITNSLMKEGMLWVNSIDEKKLSLIKEIDNLKKEYSKKIENML